MQLLLALFSSLSGLSLGPKNGTVKTSNSQVTLADKISDHAFEVPDGNKISFSFLFFVSRK